MYKVVLYILILFETHLLYKKTSDWLMLVTSFMTVLPSNSFASAEFCVPDFPVFCCNCTIGYIRRVVVNFLKFCFMAEFH